MVGPWNPKEQDHAAALDDVVSCLEDRTREIDLATDQIYQAARSLSVLHANGDAALRALRIDVRKTLKALIDVWDLDAGVLPHSVAAEATRALLERIG